MNWREIKMTPTQINHPKNPRPSWLTTRLSGAGADAAVRDCLRDLHLDTVCRGAKCPNQSECFDSGRATFMLMGAVCSRRCRYCAVAEFSGAAPYPAPAPLDNAEPQRVAEAVRRLRLTHAVITSVTRDDLPDGGAAHFAATVAAIRAQPPAPTIEILVPDFGGAENAWRTSALTAPDVYNHNLETVARLFPALRSQGDYARSIAQLTFVKKEFPQLTTKSGLMAGLGESYAEMIAAARSETHVHWRRWTISLC
jgi:lipoic acid synthetase